MPRLSRIVFGVPLSGIARSAIPAVVLVLTGGCGGAGGSVGTPLTYSVGGTVSGIDPGQSVILRNNGGDDLTVSANQAFTFGTRIVSGGAYAVTVTAPQGKACTVTAGTGAVSAAITNVAVACVGNADPSLDGGAFTGDFFFLANPDTDSISVYSMDSSSGALVSISPVSSGRGPTAIVSTIEDRYFDKRYVYVTNSRSNDVSAFAVNPSTGALTEVTGSPFAAGTSPGAIGVFASTGCSMRGDQCHTSENLYVANSGSGTVSAYLIDQGTGVLTPIASYTTGAGPSALAVGPGVPYSPFLYIATGGSPNGIFAFRIDGLEGGLTPVVGSPFPANANISSWAFGTGDAFQYPAGESNGSPGLKGLLYAANASGATASIMGFSIHPYMGDPDDGALTILPGFPYDLPSCSFIVADQTGKFLYAIAGTNIFGFSIDNQTGALSPLPGSPVAVGAAADSLIIDPANQFLYVTSRSAGKMTGLKLNAATGELTSIPGSSVIP